MGKGMFLGALAGGLSGVAQSVNEQQRREDDAKVAEKRIAEERLLMQERDKMEIARADTIDRNRVKLQSESLDRFAAILKDESGN